jgi:hypothetical protein
MLVQVCLLHGYGSQRRGQSVPSCPTPLASLVSLNVIAVVFVQVVLIACGEAVEKVDMDSLSLRADFLYSRYAGHRAMCPKCNEE